MRIVVLDGNTLNPGDLSWDGLQDLGDVKVYAYTASDEIISRSDGAEVLITNKAPISADIMASLSELRYIGVTATGYNVVDVNAARERGIVVTNVPVYGTRSVAQMTFALLLELCHRVGEQSHAVKQEKWSKSTDFCFWDYPQVELADKTMGIIGFGRIGRQVATIANAFGMHVIAFDEYQADTPEVADFEWVELEELLSRSDVVSLHCPLTAATQGLINRNSLSLMKKTAFLVNTSRGPLVVEDDLADALNSEIIAGAGLDVLSQEPPLRENPLLAAHNCIITPHIAWATLEARSRLMETTVDNLRQFVAGNPVNVVSK